MKIPRLLIPAGSLDVLKVAVEYGADEVYIGGEEYSLRAKAKNFTIEEMREGIEYAHGRGVKIYVTANIIAHNADLTQAEEYLSELNDLSPDALIISDPGIFSLARALCPDIDIHISTQANNCNFAAFTFWHRLGARRVVAARELTLSEIREIKARIPAELEIEAFVHGAMCISYSGRCLLSHYFTGRSANLGACTHPCRWGYAVAEESRPGEYMPLYENERGSFIFSSKDLCMIEHIPELVDSGIESFKVEGRMKNALYIAAVTRGYREAIDDFINSPDLYRERMPEYIRDVSACTHRAYTTGFFFGKANESAQTSEEGGYIRPYTYLGTVEGFGQNGLPIIRQKNKFSVGENISVISPCGGDRDAVIEKILDEEENEIPSAPHAGQKVYIGLDTELSVFDILRRRDDQSRIFS